MYSEPFWQTKSLDAMTDDEWESLCDGCGRCCLVKLEDIDTGRLHYTNVTCRLLNTDTCRCNDYPHRIASAPDCLDLRSMEREAFDTLPNTCAYRLLNKGHELAWWHPLVSRDPNAVHKAGISVRGKVVIREDHVHPEELEDHVID